MQPLLSICIPTYNRSQYLKHSLESYVKQEEFLNGTVEIVISDNASNDNTELVVGDFTQKYDNIRYFRNPENIKDKNYPIVLSLAQGRYRKLLNDTLVSLPDSLSYMCDLVKTYSKDRPFIFWIDRKTSPEIYELDFRKVILDITNSITYTGSFGIWENDCANLKNDTDGCEFSLWQLKKSLDIMHRKGSAVIYNKKLFTGQRLAKKNMSYGIFKVFYTNYFKLLDPYFTDGTLSLQDKEFLEKDMLFNFLKYWCIEWEMHNPEYYFSETENIKEEIYKHYSKKPYWKKYLLLYFTRKYRKQIKQFLKKSFCASGGVL